MAQFTFDTHVIPYKGHKQVATGGRQETHTLQSFADDVIGKGCTYTMVHQQRWPKDVPGRPDLTRGVKTPRIIENYESRQEYSGDDDRQIPGVVDFWLNDSFFSKYGAMFVESTNSEPDAEKGHPVIIWDQPITDSDLYKECAEAFIHRYDGKTDKAVKGGERLVYNKPGARIHMLGNICPWDVFKQEILIPYRKYKQQCARAKLAASNRQKQAAAGTTKGLDQDFDRAVADLGKLGAGDNRHGALFKLAIAHGGPLPQAVINACHDNGYYDAYAKTDKEIERIWNDGARLHTDPADDDDIKNGTIVPLSPRHPDDLFEEELKANRRPWIPRLSRIDLQAAPKFTGAYPLPTAEAHCRVYWSMDIFQTAAGGHICKARGAHYPILHSYETKPHKGKTEIIEACPHCRAERALELCHSIEKAAHDRDIFYSYMTDAAAKKFSAAVAKRNQRAGDGQKFTVVKAPHEYGTLVLHDLPGGGGDLIPTDRAELYSHIIWVIEYAIKGRRGWRGLKAWGQEEEEEEQNTPTMVGKDDHDDDDDDLEFVARLLGVNWTKYTEIIGGFLHDGQRLTRKGAMVDAPLPDVLAALGRAGLKYAVIKGELPDVLDKIYKPDPYILSGTKQSDKALQRSLFDPVEAVKETPVSF